MLLRTIACLLAGFSATNSVLAQVFAEPELVENVQENQIERRQGAIQTAAAATAAVIPQAAQYPSVTVQFFPSTIGSSTTWLGFTYTQKFAQVPDQLPTAMPGSIGYGTLTKHGKRDEPVETGIADHLLPAVLEMHTEIVTHTLQQVEQVMILHTVYLADNSTMSSFGNFTSNFTGYGNSSFANMTNGTTNTTSSLSYLPLASGNNTGLDSYFS